MPSSRGSSRPRDRTHISYVSCIGRQDLSSATWKVHRHLYKTSIWQKATEDADLRQPNFGSTLTETPISIHSSGGASVPSSACTQSKQLHLAAVMSVFKVDATWGFTGAAPERWFGHIFSTGRTRLCFAYKSTVALHFLFCLSY